MFTSSAVLEDVGSITQHQNTSRLKHKKWILWIWDKKKWKEKYANMLHDIGILYSRVRNLPDADYDVVFLCVRKIVGKKWNKWST